MPDVAIESDGNLTKIGEFLKGYIHMGKNKSLGVFFSLFFFFFFGFESLWCLIMCEV